jgi:ABC-type transporter Mla MlaB component
VDIYTERWDALLLITGVNDEGGVMEPIRLMCHPDRTDVVVGAALEATGVRAAYYHLNEALTRGCRVELHAAQLERVDAAGIQLLLAFVRSARDRGLKPEWRSASAALRSGGNSLGLADALELPA